MELSDKARELRNGYQRQWIRKHPEKVKQYFTTYWERKAAAYTPEVRARELHAQGYTQRQIAEELNISLGTVNNILNKP